MEPENRAAHAVAALLLVAGVILAMVGLRETQHRTAEEEARLRRETRAVVSCWEVMRRELVHPDPTEFLSPARYDEDGEFQSVIVDGEADNVYGARRPFVLVCTYRNGVLTKHAVTVR